MRNISSSIAAALICLITAPNAFAQSSVEQQARQLFDEGLAAAREGDRAAAVEFFEESQRLFPHPGTLLNVALYQDAIGQHAAAHRAYHDLLSQWGDEISADTRARAERRLAELAELVVWVTVATVPEGATVLLDGREAGVSPLPEPLVVQPGFHELEGRLEGYEPEILSAEWEAGERADLRLTLVLMDVVEAMEEGDAPMQDGEEGSDREAEIEPALDENTRGFWRGPWPWIIGGVLVLGAATGLAAGFWPEAEEQADLLMRFR